jgi:hypothetical protein
MKKETDILDQRNFNKLKEAKIRNVWLKFPILKSRIDNLPKDAQKYTSRKYWIYINSETGIVRFDVTEDDDNIISIREGTYLWTNVALFEYNAEYDCALFYKYRLIVSDGYKFNVYYDNTKKYHYINVDTKATKNNRQLYAIFKNRNVYTQATRRTRSFSNGYTFSYLNFVTEEVIKLDASEIHYCTGYNDEERLNSIILTKLFGVGFVGGNTYTNFEDSTLLGKFLSYRDITKKDTPKQRKVDEFLKTSLDDFNYTFDKDDECKVVCLGDRLNDEYAVLRYFIADYEMEAYEVSRLYVSKKEHIFCRKNNDGEYIYLKNKLKAEHFQVKDVILKNDNVFDGTKFEYFKDIYTDVATKYRGAALYSMVMYPEMERFWKAGLNEFCKKFFTSGITWPNYVKQFFGAIDPKQKNLNKLLGFNKHQFAKIQDKDWHRYSTGSTGAIMKYVLGMDNCCDIDDKTFDTVFDFVDKDFSSKSSYYYSRNHVDAARITIETYSIKVFISMIPTLNKFENVNLPYGRWGFEQPLLTTYIDYVNTVKLLERSSDMRPHFDTTEDLVRMHDDAVLVYNMQKDKFENERFIKRSSFWDKWVYNENETFVVIAPKIPSDLAAEGIELHHCVKSYINRVTEGSTNIMFIRKREEQDKPFFTVEVSNTGAIEQVHGFGNRNADTEEGLTEFVKEWAKARKLTTHNFNKVR